MGKLWMPMNNFKKVSEDQKSATLQHPDGHQIMLAKSILSPSMLQQLAALPMHDKAGSNQPSRQPNLARGGRVRRMATGGESDSGGGGDDGFLKKLGRAALSVDQSVTPTKLMDSIGYFDQHLSPQAFGNSLDYAGSKLTGQQPNPQPLPQSPFSLTGRQPQQGQPQDQGTNPSLPQMGGGQGQGGGMGGGQGGGQNNDPYSGGMKGLFGGQSAMGLANRGYNSQLEGGRQAMKAQQDGSQMAMNSIDQYANPQGTGLLQQNVQHLWQGWTAPDGKHVPGLLEGYQEMGAVKQDILTNKIDPNRWFNSGVLPKVVTALGLLGAMSDSKGGGMILQFVQGQMENDIRSQMADKSGKVSVLQANLQQMGNMKDAVQMTGIQHQVALSALLEKAAQTTNNEMAKANYLQYAGQIYSQAAKQLYDWKLNSVLSMNPDSGAGYGSGGGGGGGAQAGGCGPTDATGHPLPRGIPGVNGPAMQQYGPVNMPGGGTRFAGPNAQDANQALRTHGNLDADIARFNQTQQHASLPKIGPFETAGRKAKEDAVGDLRNDLRDLSSDKRLTPYQQKQIEEQGQSLEENPWIFGRGKNQQTIQDIGNKASDIMGNALSQDLYGGYTPRQARKRWNPGGR